MCDGNYRLTLLELEKHVLWRTIDLIGIKFMGVDGKLVVVI